jgi:hypothetical protein
MFDSIVNISNSALNAFYPDSVLDTAQTELIASLPARISARTIPGGETKVDYHELRSLRVDASEFLDLMHAMRCDGSPRVFMVDALRAYVESRPCRLFYHMDTRDLIACEFVLESERLIWIRSDLDRNASFHDMFN